MHPAMISASAISLLLRLPFGRGHLAITIVEIPPRGRKSPFTSAHTGFAHRTTSFEHLIDDVLLKNSEVPIRLEILFERLQFQSRGDPGT